MLYCRHGALAQLGARHNGIVEATGSNPVCSIFYIIRSLEGAKDEKTKEETDKKLEELLKDLKEDLQG